MLSKLLSLFAQAKGAAIATVVVASAATATVGATSPEFQNTVNDITATITGQSPAPSARTSAESDTRCTDEGPGNGQPVVVAQRNAAEKLLRDAYNDDHKKLEDLRGGKDQDNKAVGDIVRTYDDQLRDTLNIALNRVAALTQGRDGQVRKADASPSVKPSGSAKPSESARPSGSAHVEASESPKPSCSPKPSSSARPSESPRPSGSARTSEASESPRASESAKPSDQGRVAVADRTTLDSDIRAIVDQAKSDMDALVKKAADEVAKVPAPDHGKPSDNPGNKPESSGKPDNGAKPSENPGGGNKPAASASPKR